MNGERIGEVNVHEFQARVLAALETLPEIKADVKANGKALAQWPATCADHRIELERRMANGTKAATSKTVWIVLGIVIPILLLAAGAIIAL